MIMTFQRIMKYLFSLFQYLYDFLDALITQQTSPEEAYRKFDDLANKHTEALRKSTKQVQEARLNHDDNAVKTAVNDYEEALERYVPVLMAQAKIYWDLKNYIQVEKIFRKSFEFCNEHDIWKLNVAHTLFMQEDKFKEAVGFYEPIVDKKYSNVCFHIVVIISRKSNTKKNNYHCFADFGHQCDSIGKFVR